MKGQKHITQLSRHDNGANVWRRVARWFELGRERRTLARLTESDLKDLGLSRADILVESERPFWDDPLQK